jgi:hypothetical protein
MKRLCGCCNRPRRYEARRYCYECWTAKCAVVVAGDPPVPDTNTSTTTATTPNWLRKFRPWS